MEELAVSECTDFLMHTVFISLLIFCEEMCPAYLLLLIVKVKKSKYIVRCTDIK